MRKGDDGRKARKGKDDSAKLEVGDDEKKQKKRKSNNHERALSTLQRKPNTRQRLSVTKIASACYPKRRILRA